MGKAHRQQRKGDEVQAEEHLYSSNIGFKSTDRKASSSKVETDGGVEWPAGDIQGLEPD